MPFNDTSDGQTHFFGDGCEPPHVITSDSTTPQPTTMEPSQSEERLTLDTEIKAHNTTLDEPAIVRSYKDRIKVSPSHPDTLRERLQPCLDIWKSQGRNDEQIYGVENFLSGQGIMGIQELLSQEKERWENEFREKIEGLPVHIVSKHVTEPAGTEHAVSINDVLALISNKRKE